MTTKLASNQVEGLKYTSTSVDALEGVLLTEAVTSTDLDVGMSVVISDRSYATFDVVLASGVTPNTFNIVQCTGIPTLALVLRDTGTSYAAQFGYVTGEAHAAPAAINAAIDFRSANGGGEVHLEAGSHNISSSIILKDHVTLIGKGRGVTIIDTGINSITAIKTPDIVETSLTQTSDHTRGEIANTLPTTAVAGDFIRYKNDDRFTDRWSTVEVRPSYLEAELLKVESNSGGVVTYTSACLLDFPMSSTGKDVVTFTPTKNVGCIGMTIHLDPSIISSVPMGLEIVQCDGAYVDDLETQHYSNVGYRVSKSMHVTTGSTYHIGGDSGAGLNYGTGYSDGSKYCSHQTAVGNGCRHTITAGGTGWGIPMYVTVDSVSASNSESHAVDCHGNSAFFSFGKCLVDTGVSLSGWGHTCETALSTNMKGTSSTPYEGGIDQTYGSVTCLNGVSTRIYTDQPFKNSTFGEYIFESAGITALAFASGSEMLTFGYLKVVNIGVSTAADSTAADMLCNAASLGLNFGASLKVNSGYIEGIPIAAYCVYDNITYRDMEIVDCGWSTSLTTNDSIFFVSGVQNTVISNAKFKNLNTNLTLNGTVLRMNGTGAATTIRDISDQNTAKNHLGAINTTATHTEVRLDNVRISSGTVTHLAGSGKVSYVRGLADT
jgi:hypothetical protein